MPSPLILIVERHEGLRSELRRRLSQSCPEWRIEEAADGEAAVSLTVQLNPDVVLMEVILPKIGGIEAIRQITKDRPKTKVVVFSLHDEAPFQKRAYEAGAFAYLGKGKPFPDILAAIRSALGEAV